MKSKKIFMRFLALGLSICNVLSGDVFLSSVEAGKRKSLTPKFKYMIFMNPNGSNEIYRIPKTNNEKIILDHVEKRVGDEENSNDLERQKVKCLFPPISAFDEALIGSGMPLFPDVDIDGFLNMMESRNSPAYDIASFLLSTNENSENEKSDKA